VKRGRSEPALTLLSSQWGRLGPYPGGEDLRRRKRRRRRRRRRRRLNSEERALP